MIFTLLTASVTSQAEEISDVELNAVEVISVTPVHGVGLPKDKIPANVQTATSEDIDRAEVLDVTSFFNRNFGSVNLNSAQNNPLQPDFNFRGFTASPLLGLAQGLSVFVNGVRNNDPFGDTVNWDLIPESIIQSINVLGGANPLFGLNTLGGAVSVQTKNGFNAAGHELEVYGGAYGRNVVSLETGGNNGSLGYFVNIRHFGEDGFRALSPSDATNVYGALSWRSDNSSVDFTALYGDTKLVGNGTIPVELLSQNRDAIFTSPDITENNSKSFTLEGTHWLTDNTQLSGNAFYRNTATQSFNGDTSSYVDCSGAGALYDAGSGNPAFPLFANNNAFFAFLASQGIAREADAPSECPNDISSLANSDQLANFIVKDQNGNPVGYNDENNPLNATNNISKRIQESFGSTGQITFQQKLFGLENQFIAGFGYNRGLVNFNSQVEAATLLANRTTTRTGIFIPEDANGLKGSTTTWSGFFNNALDLTDAITLTIGGRFNTTNVTLGDSLGNAPELNGQHNFSRFNPSTGLTWKINEKLGLYGGYSESARAPTIVELACADPNASCRLPNAFLADPELKQVVAQSFEAGGRGKFGQALSWNLGFFHTINQNDIIFQSTGGATSNVGFFSNVGNTRRLGVEAGLEGIFLENWKWFFRYSFVDATFQNNFFVSSPNHPNRIETIGANNEFSAVIPVTKGNRIPGIPQHTFKLGLEVPVTQKLSLGGDGNFSSGQFLRGDEGNFLSETSPYFVMNVHANYKVTDHLTAFVTIENLFDTQYETFGILGQANDISAFQNFSDPRFLSPAPPFGGWVGFRYRL
jgi:outer membrane receptor protein involved in Fe transport